MRRRLGVGLPVVGVLGFGAVVLATSMPVSALLAQHGQLASTAAALARVRAADRSLSAEKRALSNASTVENLARSDYGLVPRGETAYVILPPAGASSTGPAGSGQLSLDSPPLSPGSAEWRSLVGLGASSQTGGTDGDSASVGHRGSPPAPSPAAAGFWGRVLQNLEFWR